MYSIHSEMTFLNTKQVQKVNIFHATVQKFGLGTVRLQIKMF